MEKVELKVSDGNTYFYTTCETEIENPLGIIKATLIEYTIFFPAEPEKIMGKLFRSKEGNWYDLPDNRSINPLLKALIKKAFEQEEALLRQMDED